MRINLRRAWLLAACLLYLALTLHQLGLPGLHYDEAKEAGLNAMQLLTGAPVTPFRDAALHVGGFYLPLMVQDYIGALNVYLALPLLGLSGIGVPNLRLLPVLTGLVALLLLERALTEWWAFAAGGSSEPAGSERASARTPAQPALAGLLAVTLLAVSPSYIFWARQGVFVSNLMLPFLFLCLWQGVRWLRTGSPWALVLAALGGGLALYAKLSAYWVLLPFAALAGGWWLYCRLSRPASAPSLSWRTLAAAAAALLLPLLPLLLFNLQTGGTLASIAGNLGRSYYGVENGNLLANAPLRWSQVMQVLRGDQFWYLGGVYANNAAPSLALLAVLGGLWRNWRVVLPPLLLVAGVFAASLFTVSDLFVTHYVLLQPLLVAAAALGLALWLGDGAQLWRRTRAVAGAGDEEETQQDDSGIHRPAMQTNSGLEQQPVAEEPWTDTVPWQRAAQVAGALLLVAWLALDLTSSLRYHAALSASGGLVDHSDASYHLAYHLQYNGMGAPIALDWGIDATVRYLTGGAVTPIEIFGYASPAAPDAQFVERLASFLDNPDNRYLLHAPEATVFEGRREAFLAAIQSSGRSASVEQIFTQRDGAPIYEIWRLRVP